MFTPKAMLRLRGATSDVPDLTGGTFEPVIDDTRVADKAAVTRVLLHSGKIHYDLLNELQKKPDDAIALVRLEQYYPAPIGELKSVLDQYPNAEVVWVQDEPENQGAWPFVAVEVAPHLGRFVRVVSRPAAASPAAGSAKRHAVEQAELIERALTL